jgi:Ni/Co efflux regulator RcnB
MGIGEPSSPQKKERLMKTTVLAMTTALLLAGGAATTASAYTRYYDIDRYDNRYSTWDRDCDGVADRYDRHIRDIHDADCDGVPNRYDRHYDRRYATRDYDRPPYGNAYGYREHRWSVGAYLPRDYYGGSYYIDYRPYGLSRPDYGYRWNRIGNDAYLVATRNGLIISVRYDVFR